MANAGTYNHTKQHFAEGSAAATPDAGEVVVYAKTDGLLYSKDDAGTETLVSGGSGGGGDITGDDAWVAKGDLIAGTTTDTAGIVTVGSNGSSLRANSGATQGIEWQKNNLAATAAPDADNDVDEGYTVGSAWFDTTNDEVYFCIDNSDGAAVWKQVGSGSGGSTELDYVEITSSVTVSGTSGTPTTCITGTSQTYAAVRTMVELFCANVQPNSSGGDSIVILLYDGATLIGRLGTVITPASGALRVPVLCRYFLTPSAGTHQYIVKAYKGTGNGTFGSGPDDGSNTDLPAYLRITTA